MGSAVLGLVHVAGIDGIAVEGGTGVGQYLFVGRLSCMGGHLASVNGLVELYLHAVHIAGVLDVGDTAAVEVLTLE